MARKNSRRKAVLFYRPLTFLTHKYVNLFHLPYSVLLDHFIRDANAQSKRVDSDGVDSKSSSLGWLLRSSLIYWTELIHLYQRDHFPSWICQPRSAV